MYPLELPKRVKSRGMEGIPPIPIINVPDDLKTGKKYFCLDGGHRIDAALKSEIEVIECIIFEPSDDPQEISKLTGNGHIESYESALRIYREIKRRREDSENQRPV